jgi:hypothetical protein
MKKSEMIEKIWKSAELDLSPAEERLEKQIYEWVITKAEEFGMAPPLALFCTKNSKEELACCVCHRCGTRFWEHEE